MRAIAWAVIAVVVLAGCAGRTPESVESAEARAAYLDRAAVVGAWADWGFSGRLAIRGADDGGSGRIDWSVTGDRSVLQFRGALGQGAWRLETNSTGAVLTRADGSTASARTADELAWAEVGWQVPVDALSRWVRGLAAHSPSDARRGTVPDGLVLDGRGLPLSLDHQGWTVTFERYADQSGAWLPGRVEATREDTRVRLVISQWQYDDGGRDS